MALHPLISRAILGAALGGLFGSGVTGPIGTRFLSDFLKPIAASPKALSAIARVMYERETSKVWAELPSFEKEVWIERSKNAVEAMIAMLTQAVAGKSTR